MAHIHSAEQCWAGGGAKESREIVMRKETWTSPAPALQAVPRSLKPVPSRAGFGLHTLLCSIPELLLPLAR